MDSYFDADFDLRDKRSKGIKNKRSKEFKFFAKTATVEKRVVGKKTDEGWSTSVKRAPALKEIDPFDLEYGVEYSLNKKNRWGKVAEARRVEQLEDLAENVKVTTIEKVFVSAPGLGRRPLAVAYHETDESGDHVERRAKNFTAQEHTLIEKPLPPKKERKAAGPELEAEESDSDTSIHVRYEINTAHPSEKYWRQKYWRIQDVTRGLGKVSNSRAKKAALNGALLNGSDDDDYFSDSEMDSYDEDFEITNDRPQEDYSLFDFVKTAEKKPKKSERFEFVDADTTVLSLSSSEEDLPSTSAPRRREIPSALKNLFTYFTVNMKRWGGNASGNDEAFDLLPEMEDPKNVREHKNDGEVINFSKRYQQIPSSPKRYLFDLSDAIIGDKDEKERFIVILERKTANKIGVTLNCDCTSTLSVSDIRQGILSYNSRNIESLLFVIVQCFKLQIREKRLNIAPKEHRYLTKNVSAYRAVPTCFVAQTGSTPVDQLMAEAIEHLVESPYNAIENEERTAPMDMECGICFSTMKLSAVMLDKCGHVFCNECWQLHCGQRMRTGVVPIPCPDASCDVPVPLSMLLSLMPVNQFAVYKRMLLDQYLVERSMGNIEYCPGCNQAINIIAPNDFHTLSCSRCNISWCQLCVMPVHWPLDCRQAALYNDRFDKQTGFERFLAWHATGEKVTSVEVKECPGCKRVIEKGMGCNHMSCRCGIQFCWNCLSVFESYNQAHNCSNAVPTKSIKLRDVRKLQWNNKMAKAVFYKCKEFRTRRLDYDADRKIRNVARKMQLTVEERNQICNARIEALYLLEWALAWLYVCDRDRRFTAIRSLCGRVEFVCSQMEYCCLHGQKNSECLKKMTDCQALSRQLVGSLRDARLIIMQYEEGDD